MSYTIIRSFEIKDNKLLFNCADSNIHPYIWYDCSLDATDSNIENLVYCLLHREYHPYDSLKLARLKDLILKEYAKVNTSSTWEKDWRYEVNRSSKFDTLFSKKIGVLLFKDFFYNENNETSYKQAIKELKGYEKESEKIYLEAKEKQEKMA